ncbi:MAG: methyltransferase domain-containing protein [Bryobacterales bacterium]|nr:methyltransferase domain-containing protein [Bryobacterales bacterium]
MPKISRRRVMMQAAGIGAAVVQPLAWGAQADAERTWRAFLAWLATIPPNDNPGSLLRDYRAHVLAGGASAAEADGQIKVVMEMMRTREDGWQLIFNKIYAASNPGFSVKPNGLLMSAVEGRKPGRALDVGMGQGRNSVFLAIRGWDVTGFDVSDEGISVARKNAAAAGVAIRAVQKSNSNFDYGTAQWDLVVITYEPFPVTDQAYVQRVWNSLRVGGLLVVESFASDKGAAGRKPVDIDPGELLRAVFAADFRIVRFEDVEGVSDWSLDRTRLARMVAEKR